MEIQVFDNFLSDIEITNCFTYIEKPLWQWGHKSNSQGNSINVPFWYMELSGIDYFTKCLRDKIEKITGKKFKINRVYANGQTYGQSGVYHQDSTDADTYTFCLYLSKIDASIVDDIGGSIQFKIPGQKYTVCFDPLFNRGLFFPSNYFHRGNSFSRFSIDLRICIAWKMTLCV